MFSRPDAVPRPEPTDRSARVAGPSVWGGSLERLLHPMARRDPLAAAVHRAFLSTRIGVSLGALALAPLCLAGSSARPLWEAAALAWLALPFGAALAVSRTGNLRIGEVLSLASWLGLGATVLAGTGSGLGVALLFVAPLEGAIASTPGLAAAGSAAAAAVAALALAGRVGAPLDAGAPSWLGAGCLLAALAYAGALSAAAARVAGLRSAEEAAALRRHAALAEAVDGVVLRFERGGRAEGIGRASQDVLGLAPADLAGRGFFERVHVADRPAFLKLVSDAVDGTGRRSAIVRFRSGRVAPNGRSAGGDPVFLPLTVSLCAAAPGPDGSAMAVVRDASAEVEGERLATLAQAAVDQTQAGRHLLLANVSHELKTPLNAIIGFAEMLASDVLAPADPAKRRDYAGIIHQSGLHLLGVVNGILDASKIEAGAFDLSPEAFGLDDLVATCCDMVGLKAQQAGVALKREVARGAGRIVGDERACRQIVLNLLSNALKFTPAGGSVALSVRPDGNSVVIAVSDTGIGVAARDLPRLGDPFFQARTSYDRPNDGTGLGLSVVRGLVGLHGGTISIESAPGHGTRVSVRLPADCRRAPHGSVIKIETIPRYSSGTGHDGVPGAGRMQRIA